ncbi:DUF1415 domain-containing protein [Janthinobacterium sp. 17J80-10]|uniref:DUF1415 domain-containing protein n=1 Tax=Janthinobacterium sp. 17J80-10 TaxID=2497863 RepID=UPI0010058949|nr:DUF1415 domain-containing protein [Janthinobacterium sp. 17J80-10]QAU33834.1 DUF1415 domain-containing protein [Janthinobacterium sp. 17J80-10]
MSTLPLPSAEQAIAATRAWVDKAVIGLNLCPFAKSVQVKGLIRYVASAATTTDELAAELARELQLLQAAAADEIDTTLLIHPGVLADFFDYNAFLGRADDILADLGLEGELQIASFHPDYQFADAAADAIENYTNRSPYPTLHLLRESSLDAAVAAFPDAADIFEKNMETMRRLGLAGWNALKKDQ